MSFKADNSEFETWLATQCDIVKADLLRKHDRMKESQFVFLRATFFRWAKQIEKLCPDLADAPAVLSVGDSHVENFGTWRDAEGRLVWGVNDFDEAANIPYPFDLVRLLTSIELAQDNSVTPDQSAASIIDGYREGLTNSRPTILDHEEDIWLRSFVEVSNEQRVKFWKQVHAYPTANPSRTVIDGLRQSLPADSMVVRFASRVKGGGSLGRPRYLVIAQWRGGQVVREAKALVPSAWEWAHSRPATPSRFLELATSRYRSPDPFLTVRGRFVFRRIAADSRKIEIADEQVTNFQASVFKQMGFDLGAIHAADEDAVAQIKTDLVQRPKDWLASAVQTAAAAVKEDFREWRE